MQSAIMNLLSELRADAVSGKISPAVSVGVISGLVVLVRGISWGVIVFSGPLAPYSSQGTSVVLFGSLAVCLVVALTGSYRGTISALPAPCVVMLVAISSTLDAASDALFMSMVATLMLSALAAGVGFLLIGRFRLADLTRFIPYPVAGGFLAGTGGALCLAALVLMGLSLDRQPLSDLLNLTVVWNWGPGITYGLGLVLVTARWKSFWILPVSFVLGAVAYHLSLPLLGISGDEARAAGLLFQDTAEGALWPAFGLDDVTRVDWTAVAGQIPNMLALVLVTLLCLVTGVGGLELAANRELEWNREFRAAGLANLVAGLGGGPPGCLITSNTVLSHLFGAETRLTGLVVAGVVGGALLFGQAVLQLVPVPLLGGVLLFTGLRMMNDWLVARRSSLPRTEYAIVVLIFVAHHLRRRTRRGGRRHGRHHSLLCRAPQPDGVGRGAVQRTRAPQQQGPSRPRPSHPAGGGRRGPRLPAARLSFFRERVPPGRPSQAVPARRRSTSQLHPAGLHSRLRPRLLGHQCPGQVHARGVCRRNAGGVERGVDTAQERVAARTSSARLRQPGVGAGRGPQPGTLRGYRHRRLEGRPREGEEPARLPPGACH